MYFSNSCGGINVNAVYWHIFNRKGDKQTFYDLIQVFKEKEIDIYTGYYEGTKSLAVVGTKKYQFINSF